jgi:predicted GNAT family acetyltransferase
MQMNDFIKKSVITHPEYLGKDIKQLVAHTANTIINQNKTAFLHVYEKNFATKLYEKLTFETRRKISFGTLEEGIAVII